MSSPLAWGGWEMFAGACIGAFVGRLIVLGLTAWLDRGEPLPPVDGPNRDLIDRFGEFLDREVKR